MSSSKLKTSTKIAIRFAIFASTLLLIFVGILHMFYFYTWHIDEKKEVVEKAETLTTTVFGNKWASGATNDEMQKFFQQIFAQGGMVAINQGETFYSPAWTVSMPNILGIYKVWDGWYARYTFPIKNIGMVGLPYEVTEHVHGQWSLFKTTLWLSLIFLVIIAIVSLFFVRYSLRPLSKIIGYIRSFRVDASLPELPISGPVDDEFVIVTRTLSEAFGKIQSQTAALQQFTTDAAHEFKTPLMIIHSEIDYALKSWEHRTGLQNIGEQIKTLDAMISTFLTIARIEKEIPQMADVNISELTEEIVTQTAELYQDKWLHVVKDIQKEVILSSNLPLLHLILSNLLSNAFKYTVQGEIYIILSEKSLSIQDSGIGIAAENLGKIWDRLYREDSSRNTENSSGLGLFLVKTAVEKLGHKIRVESEKGMGSTFTVDF